MGHPYRDRIAGYIHRHYAPLDLVVYTEVALGKTIIGKDRRVDVFVLRPTDARALGIECKYQDSSGTTDEKIPYALQDLEAMWIPGLLVYAGAGWSSGVLHTLQAARQAVRCDPREDLGRGRETLELDHVLAAVFGLWTHVIPAARRFEPGRVGLEEPGFERVKPGGAPRRGRRVKAGGDGGE
jgi:hypothetical protein